MGNIEINAEILTGILSVFGGLILILFKIFGIQVSTLKSFLNVRKPMSQN